MTCFLNPSEAVSLFSPSSTHHVDSNSVIWTGSHKKRSGVHNLSIILLLLPSLTTTSVSATTDSRWIDRTLMESQIARCTTSSGTLVFCLSICSQSVTVGAIVDHHQRQPSHKKWKLKFCLSLVCQIQLPKCVWPRL